MFIIPQQELEYLTETQLRTLYHNILEDLARRNLSAANCPLTMVTLENIRAVMRRKRRLKPSF